MGQHQHKILQLIFEVVDDFNKELPPGRQLPRDADAELIGSASIDSLALVWMVGEIEKRISEQLSVIVTLVDERSMTQPSSPFQTLGTVASYAAGLVEEMSVAGDHNP